MRFRKVSTTEKLEEVPKIRNRKSFHQLFESNIYSFQSNEWLSNFNVEKLFSLLFFRVLTMIEL